MEKEKLKEVFEQLAKVLDESIAKDDRTDYINELQSKVNELERFVAELLYGFITLNEANMRDRNQGSAPPNGFPAEKHLKVLSKITNPDRVNAQTVKQVEEAYFRIFNRQLILSQSSRNGIPDDLRIVK